MYVFFLILGELLTVARDLQYNFNVLGKAGGGMGITSIMHFF